MKTTQANSFYGLYGNYILICASFYHEHSCFHFNGTTPTSIKDTLWSHKIGILSRIDEKPFLIGGYRMGHTIIRPHRINLPSPRYQWQKYDWKNGKTSVTGGVLSADSFYGDCLLSVIVSKRYMSYFQLLTSLRTFKTEKLQENEWKEMPEFPFRDFDENAYLYHTSEVTINNEVLLFGGSCGGQCAHQKAFKFNKMRSWERLRDLTKPRKGHKSIIFNGRIYHYFGRTENEFEK